MTNSQIRIASLQLQLAELEILKAMVNGSLARVTVASNDTRDFIYKLQLHIETLEALLFVERQDEQLRAIQRR